VFIASISMMVVGPILSTIAIIKFLPFLIHSYVRLYIRYFSLALSACSGPFQCMLANGLFPVFILANIFLPIIFIFVEILLITISYLTGFLIFGYIYNDLLKGPFKGTKYMLKVIYRFDSFTNEISFNTPFSIFKCFDYGEEDVGSSSMEGVGWLVKCCIFDVLIGGFR
jgi:hypothetical protein